MINNYNSEDLQRLDPAYLERYGLTEPPFAASLSDRFFYPTAELSQQVNMLVHMTQYSDMVMLVTGNEGMGKTALLQYFLKTAHENWHICRVNANSMMDYEQLLFRIAEGYGLDALPGDSAELQELLLGKLERLHQNDILPVVIVDDADELPQQAIELLYHLAEVRAEDGPMLHIVMFAKPQINNTLQASSVASLVERLTHIIDLLPLSENETIEYINNRLRVAGAGDEQLFTDKVLKKIYKLSEGVPSRINELAHMALDDFEPAETPPEPEPEDDDVVYHEPDEDDDQEKSRSPLRMILYTTLALMLGFIIWQQDKINRLIETGDFDGFFSSKPDVEQYMPKKPVTEDEESPFVSEPEQEKIIQLNPDGTPPEQTTTDQATSSDAKTSTETTATAQPEAPGIERIEPSQATASNKQITLTIHGKNFTPDLGVTLGWTGNSKELPRQQYRVLNDKELRIKLIPGSKPDQWTVTLNDPNTGISNTLSFKTIADPNAEPVSGQKSKQQSSPKESQSKRGQTPRQWVMAQPAKHFSLQLAGSHSVKPLHDFIKRYHLQDESKLIKTRHKGKDWHILLFGTFPNKQAAQEAINAMPKSVRKNKPWMRSFASIQLQLKQESSQPQTKQAKQANQPKPVQTNSVQAIPQLMTKQLKAHQSWLWSQNPSHFTLQLLGTQSHKRLLAFIQQHQLEGKVAFYQTRRDGKPWYALVYGEYADSKQARVAAAGLPAALKKQHPWVRQFSAVHIEMDKAAKP